MRVSATTVVLLFIAFRVSAQEAPHGFLSPEAAVPLPASVVPGAVLGTQQPGAWVPLPGAAVVTVAGGSALPGSTSCDCATALVPGGAPAAPPTATTAPPSDPSGPSASQAVDAFVAAWSEEVLLPLLSPRCAAEANNTEVQAMLSAGVLALLEALAGRTSATSLPYPSPSPGPAAAAGPLQAPQSLADLVLGDDSADEPAGQPPNAAPGPSNSVGGGGSELGPSGGPATRKVFGIFSLPTDTAAAGEWGSG
ncbi:hypothetical protein N2152v2_008112 [Parachlorella kessleri]